MRIALAQINSTLGDFSGNRKLILEYISRAKKANADVVAFPELAVSGYPPEDLIYRQSFIERNLETLDEIAKRTHSIVAVIGFIDRTDAIYNAAAIISNGRIAGKYYKMLLPNYGVFDEKRYFKPGNVPLTIDMGNTIAGVNICEDIWSDEGPTKIQALNGGAHIVINISASPFHAGKSRERERMLATRAVDYACCIAYVNLVGGQDELVFDGRSVVFNAEGKLVARGRAFDEDIVIVDIDLKSLISHRAKKLAIGKIAKNQIPETIKINKTSYKHKSKSINASIFPDIESTAEIYASLILGVRDYVRKNGFKKVAVGLSGGIDSALTACLALDALGKHAVTVISMPSVFSSEETRADAKKIAKNLGIEFHEIPIKEIHGSYLNALRKIFSKTKTGVAEENIQARIRGTILMALSNKFGWLVLTTGNKSEVSTGYCTLYGDTAGGFAPLKDVTKTQVYELAAYRNKIAGMELIPDSVIKRPPTAELKPGQKDQDSLPPYPVLDRIIEAYVENNLPYRKIKKYGLPAKDIKKSIELITKSEYKRRQSPPGIKITPRAFGKDRRLPITNKFIETE